MDSLPPSQAWLNTIENLLNRMAFKLFPIWYLSQTARTLNLEPIGPLNPVSFLRHRWLNLTATFEALNNALAEQGEDWKELRILLSKLLIHKEASRMMPINFINGVDFSKHHDDWPSLISYIEHNPMADFEIIDAEDFNQKIFEAFPYENRPHQMVYREWDGRMYWRNSVEPDKVAALQNYCLKKHRDGQIYAQIITESFNSIALERLRNQWWLLLFKKESIQPFIELMQEAKLPVAMGAFEKRRDDLAFLAARKNSRRLNRVLLNLIQQRSAQNVLEFGSYISRQHHPLVKQAKKGGEITP